MKPYYEQDGITIYHGDCFELDIRPSVILTDAPYGIDYRSNHNSSRRGHWAQWVRDENFRPIANDKGELTDRIPEFLAPLRKTMICGGNYFNLPPSKCWLVWDKRDGLTPNDQADVELVWTNLDRPSRIYRHMWSGLLRAGEENVSRAPKYHPHQKPVGLGIFALSYAEASGVVFDPFMGSGSFLVAAKRMGLQAVGCEIEERYCEIAAKRLAQGALPMEFIA